MYSSRFTASFKGIAHRQTTLPSLHGIILGTGFNVIYWRGSGYILSCAIWGLYQKILMGKLLEKFWQIFGRMQDVGSLEEAILKDKEEEIS